MNRKLNLKEKFNQNGFSLLEVLVTILVLSFGLLGMAALITTGMRSNNVAQYRSIATQQTHDIADRMRANLAGVRAGNYDDLTAIIPPGSSDCIAMNCTATQIAIYDHALWNTANAAQLPNGLGVVAGNLAGGFQITMMWAEKEMGGVTDPACPGGTAANTRCFVTRFSP